MTGRKRWTVATVVSVVTVGVATLLPSAPAAMTFLHQEGHLEVPVVIVVFDELPLASLMDPLGGIDAATFPNFGKLARHSTWYRNATTTGVFTHVALPALFTGRLDAGGEREPRNLFTMLGGSYEMTLSEPLPDLCPVPTCSVAEGNVDPVALDMGWFPRGGRGAPFASFLGALARQSEDREVAELYVLHTVMPHSPWRFLPSGQIYAETEPEPGEIDMPGPGRRWSGDEWLTAQVYQRHLLQLKLADRMLGAVLRRMRTAGILDEALLVVTADHGIGFVPGQPKRLMNDENAGGIAWVPLFMRVPGQREGAIFTAPVEITDIAPSIADALNLSDVWPGMDGRSFLSDRASRRARSIDGVALSEHGLEPYRVIAARERLFRRFSDGALDLFGLAPAGTEHLIGTPVPIDVSPAPEGTVQVPSLDAYETADPAAERFPALISGRIAGGRRGKEPIAIAVNGRIAAVTRTYGSEDPSRFYALLAPRYFRTGENDIGFFLVTRTGDLQALTEPGTDGAE